MTTVLIATGTALAACTLAAFVGWLALASRRASDRMAAAVGQLDARLAQMALDLEAAHAQTAESERARRFLGELAGSIDLDEVLGRTLEAAGALPGADAVVATVEGPDGSPLTVATGLDPEEAEQYPIAGPPDGRSPRATSIEYEYDADEPGALRAALSVPLRGESDVLGSITLFTRAPGRALGPDVLAELENLALRAGPAIENARRFREARQLADLDALTELHNRRYFHETLEREVARAHRYDRRLALIVFDLDDFKEINDRIGHLAGDAVLAEVAERVREVVRAADIACRVGGDEFAVILPESTRAETTALYERLQAAIGTRKLGSVPHLAISAGIAEIHPDDDAVKFFERADAALYRAKDAGKGQVIAANDRFSSAG